MGNPRNVTRLPGLLVDAAYATIETAHRLSGLQGAVTNRLSSLDRRLRDALAVLPAIAEDLEKVRATVEPQHERVAAIEHALTVLPAVAAELERVRGVVEPQHEQVATIDKTVTRLEARIAELQSTLSRLEDDVEDATEHLPDPDAPGPLSRARDALTGRSDGGGSS
jgi:chromosome segregation ATPase